MPVRYSQALCFRDAQVKGRMQGDRAALKLKDNQTACELLGEERPAVVMQPEVRFGVNRDAPLLVMLYGQAARTWLSKLLAYIYQSGSLKLCSCHLPHCYVIITYHGWAYHLSLSSNNCHILARPR